MSIKLSIAGQPPLEVSDELITLGSDTCCTVPFPEFPNIKRQHAVIRAVDGRWQIEVCEGDSIFVGSEPQQRHWLNPGDKIRLSEQSPVIVFQPSSGRPPIDDAELDLDKVILPPDSDPSMPTIKRSPKAAPSGSTPTKQKPPSSATIPVQKTPPSGTIPVRKSPSSSSIPVPKKPSSGSIPVRKSGSSTTIPVVNSRGGSKSSGAGGRSTSNEELSDSPVGKVPTLQRMSFDDDGDFEELDLDLGQRRRKLTAEQQEMRWIMMVVGRSFGAGLAVLMVWLVIGWIGKALSPAAIETTSSSAATVEQPYVPPVAVSPPSNVVRPAPEQTKKVDTPDSSQKAATPADGEMKPDPKASKNSDSGKEAPSAKSKKSAKDPDEPDAAPKAKAASPSRSIQAVQESLYSVVMEDAGQTRRISIGTCWAVSRRYLVTTASIVTSIEEHQQNGMVASVVHIATGKSYRIKTKKLHELYTKATDAVEDARERKDDARVAAEQANQLRFDLGVLDVGRNEKLPHKAAFDAEPLEDSKEAAFVMVGLPFTDSEEVSAKIDADSIKEHRSKKPAAGESVQDKSMGLVIHFGVDGDKKCWSGSPVLNKQHKVIGVYTQLPQPKPTSGKPAKSKHGVVWIGRLNEVIAEIE